MKKVIIALIGLVLVATSTSSVRAADLPDEQWSIMTGHTERAADLTGIQLLGMSIEDNTNLSERVSNMVGRDPNVAGELGLRLCKSVDDQYCKPGLGSYLYAILPVCANDSDLNCIAGIVATKDGREIPGEYKRNFPAKGHTDFPGDAARNVPAGSTPSIWSFPNLIHSGGSSEYLANFGVSANFTPDGKVEINSYNVNINPVSIKAGRYGRNQSLDGSGKNISNCTGHCGMELRGWSQDDKFVCASLDEGFCAIRETFPSEVRFRLTARLSQSPTGWLHGRMKSPNIEIKALPVGVGISIEAEPVAVPVVGILEEKAKLPSSIVSVYGNRGGFNWSRGPYNPETTNKMIMISPDSEEAFTALIDWKDLIKDRANALPTQWAVRTLNVGGNTAQCFKSSTELVGVVTTNSMVYLGAPPNFDRENQTLDYKVASPHLTAKGEVFKGSYDLLLRSDVARCLYGFSSAPISAKISIVSESGEANVATTVVNERDGWIKMAAYGFTFSAPTVKVRLTQEAAVPISQPSPSAEPTTSASKPSTAMNQSKRTITCIKGKISKKIIATNPKCPSGFKKRVS